MGQLGEVDKHHARGTGTDLLREETSGEIGCPEKQIFRKKTEAEGRRLPAIYSGLEMYKMTKMN